MPREFDELLEQVETWDGVDDPRALATWLYRNQGGNPGPGEWADLGNGRYSRKVGRTTFELVPGLPHDELYREDGWSAWTLLNAGDAIATWQLPGDDRGASLAIASHYIDVWEDL